MRRRRRRYTAVALDCDAVGRTVCRSDSGIVAVRCSSGCDASAGDARTCGTNSGAASGRIADRRPRIRFDEHRNERISDRARYANRDAIAEHAARRCRDAAKYVEKNVRDFARVEHERRIRGRVSLHLIQPRRAALASTVVYVCAADCRCGAGREVLPRTVQSEHARSRLAARL